MKAISLHQPWASLLVTRQPCEGVDLVDGSGYCDCDQPGVMVKRFETRSWPCPPSIIGQHVAFHAAKVWPYRDQGKNFGGYTNITGEPGARGQTAIAGMRGYVFLPLGAIVGSGIITASYPIVNEHDGRPSLPYVERTDQGLLHLVHGLDVAAWSDISDQLPYGDWTPDRYAWLIEDAAPTTERCPWCRGTGWRQDIEVAPAWPEAPDCNACNGTGRCDPIPVTGRQGWWNWEPS